MKYKVGDKVTIRKDLKVGKKYGYDAFFPRMKEMMGKTVTIYSADTDSHGDWYSIKEKMGELWTNEMFQGEVQLTIE